MVENGELAVDGCKDNWFSMIREPVRVSNEIGRRWLMKRAYGYDEGAGEDAGDGGSASGGDSQIKYSKSYRHLELV